MPMNPRLLRPLASGVHPEANAWRTAVVANGGSVSASTMRAVSKFCADIDAAGIRSKIWRLNLFCGDGLTAALIPLYRGQSRTGTQYGGTTDTNNGPFVSGDYTETGASGGLKGNGTSKFINTGFEQANIALTNIHLSASFIEMETSYASERTFIGHFNGSQSEFSVFRQSVTTGNRDFFAGSFSNNPSATPASTESHVIGVRSSATAANIYRAGTSVASSSGNVGTATTSTRPYFVFARNNSGTADNFTAARMRMYSIGQSVNATEAAAFSSAVAAFNTALSRT